MKKPFSTIFLLFILLIGRAQVQRVYANTQTNNASFLSSVNNPANAIDGNLQTYSTLTVVALGNAWQQFSFTGPQTPSASSPIHIKVGAGSGILSLLSGAVIRAYNGATPVGTAQTMGNLITLLDGGNQYDIVFTPGVAYNAVRVTFGGINLGGSLDIYEAYFEAAAASADCNAPADELHGVNSLGLVSFLGSVTNPLNAIDNNQATYSVLNATVGLAAYTQQTVLFPGTSLAGDSVRLLISTPSALLSADVLNSLAIETYLDNTANNDGVSNDALLRVRLLDGSSTQAIVSFAPTAPFNRVQIRLGGVASVLSSVNVYDVKRVAATPAATASGFCQGQSTVFTINNAQTGMTYNWYTASSGGSILYTGTSYSTGTLSSDTAFYVEAIRPGGCTGNGRTRITATPGNPGNPALAPPATNICQGQTTTLTVNNPEGGVTYNWYDASSGGNLLHTGTSYTTGTLNSNVSYYVEAIGSGGCVNPGGRSTVAVTVNETPANIATSPSTQTISTGQTANINASSSSSGVTYNWYTQPANGSSVYTGSSYTTGALNTSTTYYVEAVKGSCSAARVPAVVNVAAAQGNVSCNSATSQTNTANGICIGCGVTNPQLAVDTDTTTYSSIQVFAGLTGGYAQQTLIFPSQGNAGDSIRIRVHLAAPLASVAALGSIQVATYNGVTYNNDRANIDGSLIRLNLLSGNQDGFLTFAPAATFDRVEIRVNSGLASLLTSLSISYAQYYPASPVATTNPVELCGSQSTTLSVTGPAGATFNWYSAPTGGTLLHTGTSYTTPVLSDTTTYYVASVSSNGCVAPNRTAVTVNINEIPADPTVAAAGTTVCTGQPTTLTISNAQAGVTYNWYDAAVAGTLLHTGSSYTTGTINSNTTFYVSATAPGNCSNTGGRIAVNITAAEVPANVAVIPSSQVISSGQTASFTASSSSSGVTFNWYDAAVGGVLLHTGASYTTGALTSNTTFYVEAVKGTCSAARVAATVTISGSSGGNVPCNSATTQTNTANGICIGCGVSNPQLAVDTDSTTSSIIQVFAGLTGGYAQQTLIFPTQGSAGDSIRIRVHFAAPLASLGVLGSIQVATYNGATYNNDRADIDGSLIRLDLLTGNQDGYLTFAPAATFDRVELRVNSGLASLLTSLSVSYAQFYPASPVATTNPVELCGSQSTTLSVTGPAGVTFNWYSAPTGGTLLHTGASYTTPVLTDTAIYYVASVSTNGCIAPNRTAVTVNINTIPADPTVAAAGTTVCTGQPTTLTVSNAQAGVTYNWYDAASGGTLLHTGSSYTTGVINSNTTFYVEAVAPGNCVNTGGRTTVNVTAAEVPADVVINPTSQVISSGQTASFTASSSSTGVTFNWYDAAVGGTLLHTGASYTTGALTSNTTFYVEAVKGTCSAARVAATVTISGSSGGNVPCNSATNQSNTSNGICIGCGVTNPQLAVDTDSTTSSAIQVFAGLTGGYAQQTLIFPTQGSAGDSIRIRVHFAAPIVSLGVLGSIQVATYNGATYNNDRADIDGSLIRLDLLSGNQDGFLTFAPAATFDRVELRINSGLASLLTSLSVSYAQFYPASPVATTNPVELCGAQSTTLSVTGPAGVTFNWYSAPTGGTLLHTGTSYTTPVLSDTTTYYVASVSANGCVAPNRTAVTVNINAIPADPTVAVAGTTVCAGQATTLTVSNAQAGVTYNWYDAASGGTLLHTGNSYTTGVINSNTTFYVEAVGGGNCVNTGGRTTVNITASEVPADVVVNPSSQVISSGQTASFTASSSSSGVTFNWYDAAVGGVLLHTGASYTTGALTSNTTFYVEAVKGTCAAARVAANVTISGGGGGNVPCNSATNQVYTSNGICIGCGVTNPQLAVDTDSTTSSTIQVFAGLTGGYAQQTLIFPTQGSAGDSIRIRVHFAAPIVSLGVLGSIQVATYNGATYNNDRADIDGSLIRLNLLTGNQDGFLTFAPAATFDRVELRINSGLASLLTALDVSYAQFYPASPVATTNPVELCGAQSTTLSVTGPAGATFNWYSAPTGGTLLHTGTSYTTPVLSDTTTYYVASVSANGCVAPNRTAVTVNINAIPADPTVAAGGTTVCTGQPTTLTISNAQAGVTYNWYDAASSGTLLHTGTSYTTGNINSNTTFYVEAIGGGNCVNTGGRTVVNVTASEVPADVVVNPASQVISSGQTASFTASSSSTGVTFNWYDAAVGGTLLHTGASYTTGPLTSSTTFYVEAVKGTCAAARVAATVTISGGPGGNTPCNTATAQTNTANGICIGCGVTNPQLAVDTDSTTSSTIQVFAGLTGGYAQQTLIFPTQGSAGDSIRIRVHFAAPIASLGVLGSIQVATYNGATYNNDRADIDSWLIRLNLLTGNQDGFLTFAPAATFDRVELRINSGLASLLTSLSVSYAQFYPASPVATTNPVELCGAQSTTLSVTGPAGVTFNWYSAPTGGTLLHTGASYTTPVLSDTTSYYVASVSANGCVAPNRTMVTVNVNAIPADPTVAATGTTICAGQPTTLTISNAQAGVTYNWYDAASGGTLLHTGTSYTTGTLNSNATFYVEAIAPGNCVNAGGRTTVTVTVNALPDAPVIASTGTTICAGQPTTLTISNAQGGVTYNWYDAASGGTLLGTGTSYTTGTLNSNTTFYAEAAGTGSCINAGGRTAVAVTVNTLPNTPVISNTGTTICAGQPTTLTISNAQGGVTYNWYDAATGGTLLGTGASFTTGVLNSNTTFYAEATGTGSCINTGGRTSVTVTVNTPPDAPVISSSGTTICSGQATTLTISNAEGGVTYNWYDAATGGTLLGTGTSYTTGTLNSNTTFYAEAISGSTNCTNAGGRVAVSVTVNARPDAPVISNTGTTICSGQTTTLTVSNAQGGVTYNWYDAASGGTLLGTGTSFTTGTLNSNTTFYAEAVGTGSCINIGGRTSVTVTVNATPNAPVISSTGTTICSGQTTTLTITNVQGGVTYNWYDAASGGTLLGTGSTLITSVLNSNTTIYAEAVGAGSCTNTGGRTSVTVTVSATPNAPVISSTGTTICAGQPTTLTITNAQGGVTYNWYDAASGGNLLGTGTSLTTGVLNSNTTFYAEAVGTGSCTNTGGRTAVTVTVNATPTAPVISSTGTTICSGQTTTLTITNVQGGVTYNWYDAATGGNLLGTGSSLTTGVLNSNTTFYAEAIGSGSCTNTGGRTAVTVTVNATPNAPVISSTGTNICSGQTTTLTITNVQGGVTYNWYDAASGGNLLGTGSTLTTGILTSNTTFYAEAVGAGSCTNTGGRTSVTVTVSATPNAPVISSTGTTICSGQTTTLTITNVQGGVTYNWYDAASAGTLLGTGTSFTTGTLNSNTTFYAEAVGTGSCTNTGGRTAITVTVNATPNAPVISSTGTTICSGQTTTLTITNVQGGVTYNWYDAASGGNLLHTGTSYTTGVLNSNATFYVEAVGSGSCTNTGGRTTATVTVNTLPNTPVISSTGTTICSGQTTTLTISNAQGGVTYNWYDAASGGNLLHTGTSYTTGVLNSNTSFYVQAVGTGSCTNTGGRTAVTVTVNATPNAPVISAAGTTICSGQTATLTITNVQGGVTYNWYDAATGGTLLGTGTSYTTGVLNSNTTIYAEAVGTGSCTSTGGRTAVTITVNLTPSDPVIGGSGLTTCTGIPTTLVVTNAQAGVTYNWYTAQTGGTFIGSSSSYTTPVLSGNTTFYVEAVGPGGCKNPGGRMPVVVTVAPPPAAPVIAAAGMSTCVGQSATLTISNPQAGVTYTWYSTPVGGTPVQTGNSFTTGLLDGNITYYVQATGPGGCTSGRVAVTVTVSIPPNKPVIAASGTTICSGLTTLLTISNVQTGVNYNWYSAATGGTPLHTGTTFTTAALSATTTFYVEAVSAGGGCTNPGGRTPVTVTVLATPAVPVITNQPFICPGNTVTLSVQSPVAGVTYQWFTSMTSPTPFLTGTSLTTSGIMTDTMYYVAAMSSTGCTSNTRAEAPVRIYRPLPAPVVTVASATLSTVTFQWTPVAGAAGYVVSLDNGTTFITPSSGSTGLTHTVSGLAPNQEVSIVVKATSVISCQSGLLSARVTGRTLPALSDLFVPNVFTPNNDGRNDVFRVYGTGVTYVEMVIYDQWGERIYEEKGTNPSWDGRARGQLQPVGVYVYFLKITLRDNSAINKKGSVNLIR